MKLQDAFVSELNTYVGNFTVIGYNMNNGNVFQYTDDVVPTADGTATISANGSPVAAWHAKAIVGLNDCKENSEFALFTQKAGNKNGLKWTAGIGDAAASGTFTQTCIVLTPSFKNLQTNN